MTTPGRDDLERRITELEQKVLRLSQLIGVAHEIARPLERPAAVVPPPRMISQTDLAREAPPRSAVKLPSAPATPEFSLEQWVGGRGLLLVGVLALLAAAGFFLKYAFDQGWVAPWVRVLGAIAGGIGVILAGEQQITRGLRRFGLALVGAGGGLMYLGLWAAAGPYAMIVEQAGTAAIAIVAGLIAWRAAEHQAEGLALWALLGAYTAPLVLPATDTRYEVVLAYCGVTSVMAFALAHAFAWRLTFFAALIGYFIYAPSLVWVAMHLPFALLYLALGGVAAVRIAAEHEWVEARLFAPALAWVTLIMHAGMLAATSTALGVALFGSALLLMTSWSFDRRNERFQRPDLAVSVDEHALTMLLVPVSFVIVAALALPRLGVEPAVATSLVAALYLATGWRRRWAPFVAIGYLMIAIALAQTQGIAALVVTWSVLLAGMMLADAYLDQRAGPRLSVLLGLATGLVLLMALMTRGSGAPPFVDELSWAWYVFVGATALGAWQWRIAVGVPSWEGDGYRVLWSLAGLTLLYAGSLEVFRFFAGMRGTWAGAWLAGDLAISAYWLLYAGAMVWAGFTLGRAAVRSAGLVVAGLAVIKIAFYDLQQLEALYRVGSFFLLALMSLAVAWLYNRAAKSVSPPPASEKTAAPETRTVP